MTNREILEYSKQVISAKSEIDTSQQAAPDLDEQVRTKFNEDSVNRARFIDNTLIIGAASKEFRNVFGIDAPHYEISDDCYIAVDKNGDNQHYSKVTSDTCELVLDENELLTVQDPMSNNEETTRFIDSWNLINAARFDSTMICKNNFSDDGTKLFVDKQSFFIDSKKDSESSPAHNPVCPPGYEKWAGDSIYDYICKCFDLDELNLYRLIGRDPVSTIPSSFVIQANGDNKLEYNIDELGNITKNRFSYQYLNSSGGETDEPIILASQSFEPLPSGCSGVDSAPIKWYNFRVVDNVTSVPGGYKHELDMDNSPFKECDLSIAAFTLTDTKTLKDFNSGVAILARNPKQAEPSSATRGPGYFDIQFSINLLYRDNTNDGNFDRGDTETTTKNHKFLWWEWETQHTNKKNYTITFNPINNLNPLAKKNLARFIKNMENDCLNYYNWLEKRNLNNIIPDQSNSKALMIALRDAAAACEANQSSANWSSLVTALKNRVDYDVGSEVNFNDTTSYSGSIKKIGESTYIEKWESNWVPRWPKWLRRLLKFASTPVYKNFDKIQITSKTINKNFLNSRETSKLVSKVTYHGPKTGDLTKTLIWSNSMKTPAELIDTLTQEQKNALTAEGIISGSSIIGLNSGQKYEFVLEFMLEEKASYDGSDDGIKRATDLNQFLNKNESLFFDAFTTLSDRINKRTGTLRKTYSLLESTNINYQMIEQRKHNLAHLYKYLNAYEITGGFGTNTATIKLASFEPYTSAYANLERMGTVYLFADNTTIDTKTDSFQLNWVKTIITDIIDKMSDAEYSYTLTDDVEAIDGKSYYIYDEDTGRYRVAGNSERGNVAVLYEQSVYPTTGPIFSVKLADKIPESLRGKNPRLVKVY